MAQFTKQAIENTFIELLNEKPFDKITVTDIVEKCKVNRNTFYYYYPDIYALVDEIFRSETEKILVSNEEYESWHDGFLQATRFVGENKKAIYHIYNSVRRDRLEKYLRDVIMNNMTAFIYKQAEGLNSDKQDIDALVIFYTSAIIGMILTWMDDGMKQNPDAFISRLAVLLDGNVRYTLEKIKQT